MYACHVCPVCGVCGKDRQVGHGVRGDGVERDWEEGGKTELTPYELIMQQLIARISNTPRSSPYVQVRSNLSVTVESQKY